MARLSVEEWREFAEHAREGVRLLRLSRETMAARKAGVDFYPPLKLEAWK